MTKARIRKTGEIVDIISFNHCSSIRSSQDAVSYIDSNGIEHESESLNYYWDFEPIDKDENDAHWQDVRERCAIAALQGVVSNPKIVLALSSNQVIDSIATTAICLADAIVEQLQKK